nr:unnamed protein product [Spirometra erinaceieuropaei]
MYDHCTTCPHCDRQLCDLCFKEHVDEFHTMVREKLRSLRNEAGRLKQIRATLVSHRSTVKLRRMKFCQDIENASNDLLSACKTAVSKSESYLNRVRTQSKEKFTALLNNRKLVELVIYLHRAANNPAQHELKDLGVDGETLDGVCAQHHDVDLQMQYLTLGRPPTKKKTPCPREPPPGQDWQTEQQQQQRPQKPSQQQTDPQNLKLSIDGVKSFISADILKAYFARFGEVLRVNLHVGPTTNKPDGSGCITLGSTADKNQIRDTQHIICGVRINVKKCSPLNDAKIGSVILAGGSWKQVVALEPLPSKRQLETTNQKAPFPCQPIQQYLPPQQQSDSLKQQAVDKSQKPLELFLDGVKAEITVEDLKTYFARFGEVLAVTISTNPVTNKANGSGSIRLRPTSECGQVLETEHLVCGVRINVRSGVYPTTQKITQ